MRAGPRVEHSRYATLDEALRALDARVAELAAVTRREEVRVFRRRIEPVAQVAARLEVAGPGGLRASVRGGVDLRGDGSAEAYVGRLRRTVVEQRRGESATDALRRALSP